MTFPNILIKWNKPIGEGISDQELSCITQRHNIRQVNIAERKAAETENIMRRQKGILACYSLKKVDAHRSP